MGRFGSRVGTFEALAFSTMVQLLITATLLFAVRGGIGGLTGATVVFAVTFAQPKIGATATIGILIAGQLVMGAVIDRFGLFGVDRIDISTPRAVGIVLLGIGAALSLVR